MFNFFRKKIDTTNIRNFQDVIKVSNFYISEKKWDDARNLLKISKNNEKINAENQINSIEESDIEYQSNKINILNIYSSHLDKLLSLEEKLTKNENKFKFIPEGIRRYSDAIKSIKTLSYLKEWEKAKNLIKEIKSVEKTALDNLLDKLEKEWDELSIEWYKKKQLSEFKKKEKQLEKILENINDNEKKYIEERNKEKFKIRFKKIKNEIELLSKTWKSQQALNLLRSFLSDNKDNSLVIKFYNKEKHRILKNIEAQKKKAKEKLERNIKAEAMVLAWKTIKLEDENLWEKKINKSFFTKFKEKFNFYQQLREKLRRKRLLDEVTLLIEENKSINKEMAERKLAKIHKWLVKEINDIDMDWYDLYWKILWADKISWDTFWMNKDKKNYNFFLWDATWHWIKAWLIITLFTRLFNKFVGKVNLQKLAFEINNWLKQDLQSRNFITWILFEIERNNISTIKYVWMWHEPMLIYRKKTKEIEKLIPGWLASGIRNIKNISDIAVKKMKLEDWDILLTYSDWIIESKNPEWELYWLKKLEQTFKKISEVETKSSKIYSYLIDSLILFRGWTAFDDDATIMLLKRDPNKDIQEKDSKYIRFISKKEWIAKKDQRKFSWKNKEGILSEIKKIKKEKKIKLIVNSLKRLYQVWEFLKLKQEAIRYIKEWHVHKEINFYLKKALANETKYKIRLKNKKIDNRYNVIKQLYKNWDYNTVIREIEDIISKDWEI